MLAKVLTLSLLAVAALAIEERAAEPDQNADADADLPAPVSYETVEARLLDGVVLRRGPSYLVPARQCQATLTPDLLCGKGLVVASLEVKVLSSVPHYADILFEMRDQHQVRVIVKPCPRPWTVDLRLACLRQKPSRSHSRVPWVSRSEENPDR